VSESAANGLNAQSSGTALLLNQVIHEEMKRRGKGDLLLFLLVTAWPATAGKQSFMSVAAKVGGSL